MRQSLSRKGSYKHSFKLFLFFQHLRQMVNSKRFIASKLSLFLDGLGVAEMDYGD
jgi:hypothetical protein